MAEIRNGKLIFKVATYNIAAQRYCLDDTDAIGRDLAESGADIVGLQEVDMFTKRTGERDMLSEIAAVAGYPHRRFIRAIDYKGGQYGTAILSKYPIDELEVINLDSTSEKRSVGRFVINILGVKLNYFNTHVSYIRNELLSHLDQLSEILKKYDSYVITADFNTNDFGLFDVFHGHRLANNSENELFSYPATKAGIDNIIMTEDFDYSSPELGTSEHSDHRMLTAILTKNISES